MVLFGLAMALVAVLALAFWKWGTPPPPPVPVLNGQPLSELFPDLKEEDWQWLQSVGGYAAHPIYRTEPAIPLRKEFNPPIRHNTRLNKYTRQDDAVRILDCQNQTIAAQQENIKILRENNQAVQNHINFLTNWRGVN
jgi:hypothetical protein